MQFSCISEVTAALSCCGLIDELVTAPSVADRRVSITWLFFATEKFSGHGHLWKRKKYWKERMCGITYQPKSNDVGLSNQL